jgi:hypothetical protein
MANVEEEVRVARPRDSPGVPKNRKWIIYSLVLVSTTLQSLVSVGLVNGSFSTLERRFSMSSKLTGFIAGLAHVGSNGATPSKVCFHLSPFPVPGRGPSRHSPGVLRGRKQEGAEAAHPGSVDDRDGRRVRYQKAKKFKTRRRSLTLQGCSG